MIDRRDLLLAGGAGIAQLGQRVLPRITLPELIDPPAETLPAHLTAEAKVIQQLRFIMVGGKHWLGLGKPSD